MPLEPPPLAKQNFVWQPPYRPWCTPKTSERPTKASSKRKGGNDTQILCPRGEAATWSSLWAAYPTLHTYFLPPWRRVASPLSSLLQAWLGWKSKPRGSAAVSGCNYSGRTDFLWVPDFQIRASRKLDCPTFPHCPSSPQKESFLSSYTDTEQPVSATELSILIRAYSVPTSNSLRKQREKEESGTPAGCHIHLHN